MCVYELSWDAEYVLGHLAHTDTASLLSVPALARSKPAQLWPHVLPYIALEPDPMSQVLEDRQLIS